MNKENKAIVIIGGSTGGSSLAAQLRRQNENMEIILLEKSAYVSTAYCGMAYAAGGIVRTRDELIPLSSDELKKRFSVDVRINSEVIKVNRDEKAVIYRDLSGQETKIYYEKLIFTMGAMSRRLPILDGVENVYSLRTIEDLDAILKHSKECQPKAVAIIGSGFIGLELAESFRHKGIEVHVIEKNNSVMSKVSPELSVLIHQDLEKNGVHVHLSVDINDVVKSYQGRSIIMSKEGVVCETDMILSVPGIFPATQLAKDCGINTGSSGGIIVNSKMITNDDNIYSLGDIVEVPSRVTGYPVMVSLAAPLSQQVRIVAGQIKGNDIQYPGALGSFVCKSFDVTIASTGVDEDHLKLHNISYEKVLVPTTNHVYFYPGVASIYLKVLFDKETGKIYGAQSVGGEGTEKRIDIIATAINAGQTVYDLEYLELCYAPPYGSPRDPVNLAGSIAANRLRKDIVGIYPDDLKDDDYLIDIRTEDEFEIRHIDGAINIPAVELRERVSEIPEGRRLVMICLSGSKSNTAQRYLGALGYNAVNLLGGMIVWKLYNPETMTVKEPLIIESEIESGKEDVLDLRGLVCPGPIVSLSKNTRKMKQGDSITVHADDPAFLQDLDSWAKRKKVTVMYHQTHQLPYVLTVTK